MAHFPLQLKGVTTLASCKTQKTNI